MFKKPAVWILLTLLSVSGIVFSFIHYPTVFPIVNLDIKMDRQSALLDARDIAQKYNLGPKGYKQAANFALDDDLQYYVELEAGGSEAFQKLIKEGLYSPYIWEVRHFKEGEINESEIRFTPSGEPYGYSEWLSEDAPGASLTQDEALKVAKTHTENLWNITCLSGCCTHLYQPHSTCLG